MSYTYIGQVSTIIDKRIREFLGKERLFMKHKYGDFTFLNYKI